jgi:hypothetical protein
MTIIRAVFWLTAIAILLPQEAALERAETAQLVGKSPAAQDVSVPEELLGEFKAMALKNLYRLKQQRAAQKDAESRTAT